MGDAAMGLDLAPPDAAMAETDAVDIERLGNHHVIDAGLREEAAAGEIGNAAIAARFLVDRSGDLDRARKPRRHLDQRFRGDDRRRDSALHVAGAAAIDPAVADGAGEGFDGPALAHFNDIDMAVEMDARAGTSPVAAG